MNNLKIFEFESNEIRFLDGLPIAEDVAKVLRYSYPYYAVYYIVDKDYKDVCQIQTPDGVQETTVLKEGGVYQLIFKSESKEAKSFQSWIFEEVFPSLRKTNYSQPTQFKLPQTYKEALLALVAQLEENERLKAQIEADKPNVDDEYAQAVKDASSFLEWKLLKK